MNSACEYDANDGATVLVAYLVIQTTATYSAEPL